MLSSGMINELVRGIFETLYMTVTSTAIAYVFGIPMGIVLYITDKNGICRNRPVNIILGFIVNVLRSVPFLILLVAILPFTRLVVGTTIGNRPPCGGGGTLCCENGGVLSEGSQRRTY